MQTHLAGKALALACALLLGSGFALTTLAAGSPFSAADAARQKLFLPSNFKVEIDGVIVGGSKDVSGIEAETEMVEYKDGEDGTTHTRPGNHKPGIITLTRDFSKTDPLRTWFEDTLAGKDERKSVAVIYINDAGQEAMRYNFFEAWPCKWHAPTLNAKNSGHVTEDIEFCMSKLERK